MFLRSPTRAIRWSLAFVLGGAAIFLCLNVASAGQWWLQAIVANVNAFIPAQATGLFVLWFKLHGFLLFPAALLLIYEFYFDRLSIFSLWFVFSAIFGGLAAGSWGAGDSYFVTSVAAACILSGVFFSRLLANDWRLPRSFDAPMTSLARAAAVIIPLLYLGYARATLKMPTDGMFAPLASALGVEANTRDDFYDSASYLVGGYARIGYFLSDADWQAGAEILRLIEDTDGPVLSEEAGFTIAAGRDVVTNPTQLRNLHLARQFEGEQLIGMIERGEFGIVILRAQFYPPPVLEAIHARYRLSRTIHMNGFDYSIPPSQII